MAVAQAYGKTVTSGSVFAYDTGDTVNSFKGQPTTNDYGSNFRDFTGTGYSPYGEWTSNPTSFTKTYYPNLTTPIGPGGTLIEESGTTGFHHLSRYGGGSESGAHCLSCYIYPLVSGITDFCIGMLGDGNNTIQFNLDTRAITYNGGISNRNAFIKDIPGYPGWLRVGANFEGRGGGWVGCVGYSSYTSYTGTAGGKKAYITGIQYEYTTQPTPFVAGTRSATQGLLPLVGNSSLDLSGTSFNSNAQIAFDGTDDYITIGNFTNKPTTAITCEAIIKPTKPSVGTGTIRGGAISSGNSMYLGIIDSTDGGNTFSMHWANQTNSSRVSNWNGQIPNNQYSHLVGTYDGATARAYLNGVEIWSTSQSGTIPDATYYIATYGGTIVDGTHNFNGEIPIARMYNRALSAAEVKQNFDFYNARFGIDVDTYYFVVSNRAANLSQRYLDGSGNTVRIKARNMASTTPAYIIYQKPDSSFQSPSNYTEVARDNIGTPTRITFKGVQTSYSSGRYFTTVTVHKSRKDGILSFAFPNGGTSQYGEDFYKTIVTPYVP